MAKAELESRLTEARSGWISTESSRIALVVVCAVIAFVAGAIGADVQGTRSWTILLENFSVLAGVLVATVALLRVVDMVNLRRRRFKQADWSRARSQEFLRYLEGEYPGIAERTKEIDAEALVDRALQTEQHVPPSINFQSKVGA